MPYNMVLTKALIALNANMLKEWIDYSVVKLSEIEGIK
jgi:hypothetical protein